MILLDTSAIIDMAGNKKWVLDVLQGKDQNGLSISVVSIAEIKTGQLRTKNSNEAVYQFLDRIITDNYVSVLNIDSDVAERYAKMQHQLRTKGLLLSPFDGLIAATALEKQAILVTNDSDFKRVKELKLITP